MKELSVKEVETINGGTNWHNWLIDTATECGCAAAATSELPPVGIGCAVAGAVLAGAAAISDVY